MQDSRPERFGAQRKQSQAGSRLFEFLQRTPEGRVTNSRRCVGKPCPLRIHAGARARRPRLLRQGVQGTALVRPGPRIRSPGRGAPRGRGDERAEGAGGASWEIQQHGAPGLRAPWPPRVPAAGAAARLTSEPRPASRSWVPPASPPRPRPPSTAPCEGPLPPPLPPRASRPPPPPQTPPWTRTTRQRASPSLPRPPPAPPRSPPPPPGPTKPGSRPPPPAPAAAAAAPASRPAMKMDIPHSRNQISFKDRHLPPLIRFLVMPPLPKQLACIPQQQLSCLLQDPCQALEHFHRLCCQRISILLPLAIETLQPPHLWCFRIPLLTLHQMEF